MAHWKMDFDADGYVWLTIDVADKSVNVLTHEVLEELDQLVSNLSKQEDIKGLALLSGKSGGFVYGADVRQFELLKDAETVSDHINAVHHTMNSIANLPYPTVVGIDGIEIDFILVRTITTYTDTTAAASKTSCSTTTTPRGVKHGRQVCHFVDFIIPVQVSHWLVVIVTTLSVTTSLEET